MTPNKNKYSFNDKEPDLDIGSVEDSVDHLLDTKKLDENNPMERAIKFNEIRKNPPKPGFMEVRVHEEEVAEGDFVVISESDEYDDEGKVKGVKKIIHDVFLVLDLNIAMMANVSQCPINVAPMLIDQKEQLVDLEKKSFKTEKRRDEFNYWWILFIVLIGIPAVVFILLFFAS